MPLLDQQSQTPGREQLAAVPNLPPRLKGAFILGVIVALATWIFLATGKIGYAPIDEGYLQSQSLRIARGQVPHRDFITPRPAFSGVIHLIDFASPLPLFVSSRLVATLQVVAYSFLFATVIYRRRLAEWSWPQVVGAAASSLVNLHVFPLMAWYTIDGLTLISVGLVLLLPVNGPPGPWRRRAGLLSLGAAAVVKQSFVFAPVLGLLLLSLGRGKSGLRSMPGNAFVAALPGLAYLAVVSALGGFEDMTVQLGGGRPVYGGELWRNFRIEENLRSLLQLLGLLIAVTLALWASLRLASHKSNSATPSPVAGVSGMFLAGIVVWTALSEKLAYAGVWGLKLMWAAIIFLLLTSALSRSFDRSGAVLIVVAWMTMLSWGYAVPNLAAGTLALYIVHRSLDITALPSSNQLVRTTSLGLGVASLTAFALVAHTFLESRGAMPYFDRADPQLTAPLGQVSATFDGIRTNQVTAAYLTQIKECIESYPAREVAVLPDNPGIYAALHLENPFPIDWMFPQDFEGSDDRLLEAASSLNTRDSYLVLFQTFSAFELAGMESLPTDPVGPPFLHGTDLGIRIFDSLNGDRVTCGPFLGVHR